jgi:hypothetical protein
MRTGLPGKEWSRVVTLYDDAAKLRDFIGDNRRQHTHLVLLDADGKVNWFNSDGFSVEAGSELLRLISPHRNYEGE